MESSLAVSFSVDTLNLLSSVVIDATSHVATDNLAVFVAIAVLVGDSNRERDTNDQGNFCRSRNF